MLLNWGNVFKRKPDFKMEDLEPDITDPEPMWSGKRIFSTLLPEDLNILQRSNFGDPKKTYKEGISDDGWVRIVNGQMVSGALDEKSYGSGKPTSLLLRLVKDYGNSRARQWLDDTSNMLLYVIMDYALTIGLDEVDITHIMPNIDGVIQKANEECDKLIKAFHDDDQETMPCLPGRTYNETLEIRIMDVLNRARDEAGKIASVELGDTAHSVIMTKSGARGNPLNLTQMAACVGQQAVRSKRIHRGFNNRTLPHFKLNDLTPKARGFVTSSYRKGLDPIEFFMHAMGGREGLVDTAVRTSSSGYMQRRLVNALQDMVVQNDGTVRTSTDNIVQFVYGDDMVDPGKSDHSEAVNIDNIYLKVKSLESFKERDKTLRNRKRERLGDVLSKKENDYLEFLEKYEIEFDAENPDLVVKDDFAIINESKLAKVEQKSVKKREPSKKSSKKSSKKPSKKLSKKKTKAKRDTSDQDKSKEPSETGKLSEEDFQRLYNEETGKNAIYRGKMTKIYKNWRSEKKTELGL